MSMLLKSYIIRISINPVADNPNLVVISMDPLGPPDATKAGGFCLATVKPEASAKEKSCQAKDGFCYLEFVISY